MDVSGVGAFLPKIYGPIRQLAFVPADFDAAIKFWSETMGVGPFFHLEHLPLEDVVYRGQPIAYDSTTALAFWGDIEIEIIRQHNDGPSMITEWLDAGREGVHHVRLGVDDVDEAAARLTGLGGTRLQSAKLGDSGRYVMMEMPGALGIVEISELSPTYQRLFDYMKRAARDWDGRDPLRPVPPESEWL